MEREPDTPPPITEPEQAGSNPSDFRTPLPYEAAASPPEGVVSDAVATPDEAPEPAPEPEPGPETAPATPEPEPIPIDVELAPTPPGEEVSPPPGPSPELTPEERYDDYVRRYSNAATGIKPRSFEQWQRDEGLSGGGEGPPTEEDAPADMAPERRRGFRALPERSRSVLRRMYDRVAAEPEFRRVIGKMEVAYHQYFLDKHQERSAKLKSIVDFVDARLEGMDEARADIEADVTQMERDGEPGSETLKMSLQKLDRSRAKIMAERDKFQTDFEAVDNKAKLRATKRDAVADRLIDAYDKELLPLESELEALQTARDQVELTVTVTEAKHKELTQRAEKLQEKQERIAENMRRAGSSEKDIRRAMSSYDIRIEGIAEQISRDEEAIATWKLGIDARVAKVDAEANPYRDKREEFVLIKNSRPIDIEIETRNREVITDEETPTIDHPREFAEPGVRPETTTAPEVDIDPRPEVSSYISQWNEHLAAKGIDGATPVDLDDFTKAAGIREAAKLDSDDFKKILAAYLKLRKVPSGQYATAMSDFLAGT